ncbi:MAG: hypothetical protein HQK77_22485 [Desulfobacterales bacterium]|nr:hypothetical protein [Desulfobacterales bacterium]
MRGEKAGGTKEAYIVSFIDDWQNKINWVNPGKLFIDENVDFSDSTSPETRKRLLQLISIEKMEEFAKILDETVDTTDLEKIDFIKRIPVGLYCFSILPSSENSEDEKISDGKTCEVLVYDNIQKAYSDFINDLPKLFKDKKNSEQDEKRIENLSKKIDHAYFSRCEKLPAYRIEDVKDILHFYAQTEEKPLFVKFSNREQFDISKIAQEIFNKNLSIRDVRPYQDEVWNDNKISWQAFFGYNQDYFIRACNLELEKLQATPNPLISPNPPVEDDCIQIKTLLNYLSKEQLKNICQINELALNGSEDTLIERISSYFNHNLTQILDDLFVNDLKSICRGLRIAVYGNKEAIINRILRNITNV